MMNRKINWGTIRDDIKDARKQLEEIEKRLARGEDIDEPDLKVMLQHAYFHLNYAWNARHVERKRYAKCANRDFNKWGRFPKTFQK